MKILSIPNRSRHYLHKCHALRATEVISAPKKLHKASQMGLVCITPWCPNFNGSHFGLPPISIHKMTGWVAKMV